MLFQQILHSRLTAAISPPSSNIAHTAVSAASSADMSSMCAHVQDGDYADDPVVEAYMQLLAVDKSKVKHIWSCMHANTIHLSVPQTILNGDDAPRCSP